MPYRVKKEFQKFMELTTVVDGRRVALNQSYVHETRGTATKPPETISVPLATQAELKAIFERGDPCIEQCEEAKAPEIKPLEHETVNPYEGVTDEMLEEVGAVKWTKKKKVKEQYEP